MDQNQEKTIEAYNQKLNEYIEGTPSIVEGDVKDWIDKFLSLLTKQDVILEAGSGLGRDADYIESKEYKVIRTDLSDSFINYQKSLGKNIQKYDLLIDIFHERYDAFFANAVLLHFNKLQTRIAFNNIKSRLKTGNLMAFSLKTGEGDEWSTHKLDSPRYFKYWTENELREFLAQEELEVVYLTDTGKWLHVICKVQ